MPEQVWADVDEFFTSNLLPADDVLRATLETNVAERLPPIAVPFDFVFVDADKASSDVYFKAVLTLSHPGTVIIVDNVVRDGKVADASSDDEDIRGIRRMTEWLKTQKQISATAIQTVGGKSYDGFLMAIV